MTAKFGRVMMKRPMTFDYSEFFHVVKDEISSADIAMADLETTWEVKSKNIPDIPCSTVRMTG
jgi:hypothetical protein